MVTKKRIALSIFCLLMVLVSSFWISACKKKSQTKKYDIQFMVGEEVYHTINTSGNTILEFPANPTQTGYEFVGWYLENNDVVTSTSYESENLTADLTVYAKFEIKEYTISYQNLKGATNPNETKFTMNSSEITITDISQDGYTFLGWYDALDGGNKVEKIPAGSTEDKTLYARWITLPYSITYKNAEGSERANPNAYTVESNEITLVDIAKEKYIFAGWYDAAEGGNEVKSIPAGSVGNKTIYARWIDYVLDINYDTDKLVIRDSDVISADLFKAECSDNDNIDEEIEIIATYEGTQKAGNTINIILSATSNGVTTTERIENVEVKETPNIISSAYKHLYSDDNLDLLFNCEYQDGTLPITYEIKSGKMNEGETIVFKTSVTDECGVYSEEFTYDVLWAKEGLFINNGSEITGLTIQGVGMSITLVIPYEIDGTIITKIGRRAFKDNYTIRYLETPHTLQEIGDWGFENCINISEIAFGEGLQIIRGASFSNNYSLSEVIFPESLTILEGGAFRACDSLKIAIIPENVTTISSVFIYCKALETVEIKNPDAVFDSLGSTFEKCTSLTEIKLPEKLKIIPRYAFFGCTSLYEIDLPSTLEEIGAYAFAGCTNLRTLYIPLSVVTIGNYALGASTNILIICEAAGFLSGWTQYSGITTDGKNVGNFYFGINKTNYYDDGITKYYRDSYNNEVTIISVARDVTEYEFVETVSMDGVDYPVKIIGTEAFFNATQLRRLVVPSYIISAKDNAFGGCSQLIIYFEVDDFRGEGYWKEQATILEGYSEDTYYFDGTFEYMIDKYDRVYITGIVDGATMVKVPTSVTFGEETYEIYGITSNTFKGLTNLISVYIPKEDYVTMRMFEGCDNLVVYYEDDYVGKFESNGFYGPVYGSITDENYYYDGTFEYVIKRYYISQTEGYVFEAMVTNFRQDVTDVNIPSSITINGQTYPVTQLAAGLFSNHDNPITVTLPSSITTIQANAFENCYGLTSIALNEGVTAIGDYAFYECRNLTSILIPSTLETLGQYAFSYCTSLETIDLTSKVTTISKYAFEYSGLKTMLIPNNITNIDHCAFNNCENLSEIFIPKTVIRIATGAVGYGKSVIYMEQEEAREYSSGWNNSNPTIVWNYKGVIICNDGNFSYRIKDGKATVVAGDRNAAIMNIPASVKYEGVDYPVTEIGDGAFAYYENLVIINIPNGVTRIGNFAFYFKSNETYKFDDPNPSLTKVNMPDTVTEIGDSAFENCTKLVEVRLSNNLVSIGTRTFSYAPISNVVLPNTLESIGNYAFNHCDNLGEIIIPASVKTIGHYVFYTNLYPIVIKCYVDGPQEGWNTDWYSDNGKIQVVYNYTDDATTE